MVGIGQRDKAVACIVTARFPPELKFGVNGRRPVGATQRPLRRKAPRLSRRILADNYGGGYQRVLVLHEAIMPEILDRALVDGERSLDVVDCIIRTIANLAVAFNVRGNFHIAPRGVLFEPSAADVDGPIVVAGRSDG